MNKNLNELIKILEQKKNDYYLISTYDEYLFEYVSEKNMRLKWLTNFSGTNGIALISKKKKYFFTDGRYLLQAKKELSKQFELIDITATNFLAFVKAKIYKSKILVDFKLFKTDFIRKLKKIADSNQNSISHDCANIIDKIWKKRPKELKKKLFFVDKSISGETLNDKKRKLFHNNKYDYFIITSSDSICWLLNIRGYDLPHTPIVFSKLVVSKKIIKLFVDPEKLPKKEIKLEGVQIYSENEFQNEIYKISKKATILLDNSTSYFYYDFLSSKGFKFDLATEPCANLKCQKNTVEILNAKKAHQKDGLSLVKFFYWLDSQNFTKQLTEFNLSEKLESFRRCDKDFFSPSFPTISATGSNGSIIHYFPQKKSLKLKPDQLYLCDSGGQYFGATTDVTRTIYLGNKKPNKEFKSNYTNVLKGHIDLSMMKFPVGTRGSQIDVIARNYLWRNGLDYDHGTGHGVGSFLGVHEGPQSISKNGGKYQLKEGMILSNEPGFYKNNNYGIRIENLILVVKSEFKGFLEFETLTLYPYEKNLIQIEELSVSQKKWINIYHSKVYKILSKSLKPKEKLWLRKKTERIK